MLIEKRMRVLNTAGIHASPSAQIVQTVMLYDAKVLLMYETKSIDVCSILELLSLGLCHGAEFILRAEGTEAQLVMDALERLFNNELL